MITKQSGQARFTKNRAYRHKTSYNPGGSVLWNRVPMPLFTKQGGLFCETTRKCLNKTKQILPLIWSRTSPRSSAPNLIIDLHAVIVRYEHTIVRPPQLPKNVDFAMGWWWDGKLSNQMLDCGHKLLFFAVLQLLHCILSCCAQPLTIQQFQLNTEH